MTQTTKPEGKLQFSGLDMIRFFAATLVTFKHLAFAIGANDPEDMIASLRGHIHYPAWNPFTWFGWVGVEIFFVISGFVIAFTANGTSPFQFFRSRFLRLVPTVWVCASLTALVLVVASVAPLSHILLTYLRTLAFVPKAPWIDSPYWTLSVEVSFYMIIFLLICLNQFIRVGALIGTIGLISSTLWMAIFLGSFWTAFPTEKYFSFFSEGYFHVLQVSYGANFAVGVLMWLILLQKATFTRVALFAYCLVGSLCEIYLHEFTYKHDALTKLIPLAIWLGTIGFMMISVVYNHHLQNFFPKFFRIIGLMTFPLYLLHNTIGIWLITLMIRQGLDSVVALLFGIIAVVFLSWLMMQLIEPRVRPAFSLPLDHLGRKLLNTRWGTFLFRKANPLTRT